MPKKPLVGITRPVRNFDPTKIFFSFVIRLSGGKPIFLTSENYKNVDEKKLSGLIISGGTDVNPKRYGKRPNTYVQYDEKRDSFEFDILDKFIKLKKPILGVCRGMQLINIYCSGTLFTDVKKVYDKAYTPQSFLSKTFYRKRIFLEPYTILNNTDKIKKMRVNSIHNQSIDKMGKFLKKTAYDRYGIIQAVEGINHSIFGVQWHPEYLFYKPSQIMIFKKFIKIASTSLIEQKI